MYNRILKRPMFKRGGSSYEAQGTGITSPYDTPRRGYAHGVTQEEINERRANLYQDPRSDWSYAAQGFSALANPYTKKGEAKTIGEMLYEGAHDVRGSKAEGRGLEQAAELANIQSDEDILRAEEKFERDKTIASIQTTNPLLKDPSIPRQVETEQSNIIKIANANPANVVKKNWPMSTIVTSKKVFKKYCSHGAPSHATRKLSKVQEDIRLKFTASDVE